MLTPQISRQVRGTLRGEEGPTRQEGQLDAFGTPPGTHCRPVLRPLPRPPALRFLLCLSGMKQFFDSGGGGGGCSKIANFVKSNDRGRIPVPTLFPKNESLRLSLRLVLRVKGTEMEVFVISITVGSKEPHSRVGNPSRNPLCNPHPEFGMQDFRSSLSPPLPLVLSECQNADL